MHGINVFALCCARLAVLFLLVFTDKDFAVQAKTGTTLLSVLTMSYETWEACVYMFGKVLDTNNFYTCFKLSHGWWQLALTL